MNQYNVGDCLRHKYNHNDEPLVVKIDEEHEVVTTIYENGEHRVVSYDDIEVNYNVVDCVGIEEALRQYEEITGRKEV